MGGFSAYSMGRIRGAIILLCCRRRVRRQADVHRTSAFILFDSVRILLQKKPPYGRLLCIFYGQDTGVDYIIVLPPSSPAASRCPPDICIYFVRLCPYPAPKKEPPYGRLFFGAGYGSRTRLHGLGSRCITDIRILRLYGYYNKAPWEFQPLFVDSSLAIAPSK